MSMNERERERWDEMVNDISDICNTTIIFDSMTLDEVVAYYDDRLRKIEDLLKYCPETEAALKQGGKDA